MSVDELARLDALVRALKGQGAEAMAYGIAKLLPHIGMRRCDASDVLEDPYQSSGACDLHLLDASGHCIRVTDDPGQANAILIAERTSP